MNRAPSAGRGVLESSRPNVGFWLMYAAATVIVIMVAATRWSFDNPYGTSWDEAEYINQVLGDHQRLEDGKFHKVAGRILKGSGRPPAYRVLALPLVTLFGAHTETMRLLSLLAFALSAWFVYSAARLIASPLAGAFAVLIFALSPEVVSASLWFSTEGPLYVATSAMLYYLFVSRTSRSERPANWIGLGLAVGLGLVSKVSFLVIAPPVLGFWLLTEQWPHLSLPKSALKWKSGLLALLIGAPWYVLNFRSAIAGTEGARAFMRNSLGPLSLRTLTLWSGSVLQSLLGHGVSILIALIAVAWLRKVVLQRNALLDPLQRWAMGACACAGVPIMLAQLSGTNHLIRHISPAIIPLAIAVGVIADKAGWACSKTSVAVSGLLLCGQLLMIVSPAVFPNRHAVDSGLVNGRLPWRVMFRRDQWDWQPLQQIASGCGLEAPAISYLGNGPGFSPPQMAYAWVAKGADIADPQWLWRYEEGPLDWQKVMNSVGQSDVVLTAPHYPGRIANNEPADNQHNAELAERLSRDARFQGPIHLEMGRFEPVEIDVFLKKTAVCRLAQGVSANP